MYPQLPRDHHRSRDSADMESRRLSTQVENIDGILEKVQRQIDRNHQTSQDKREKMEEPPAEVANLTVENLTPQALNSHGAFFKQLTCACHKYAKQKKIADLTAKIYRQGVSQRLFVGKDAFAKKRSKLPILVIGLDGVMGYFDEAKAYNIKQVTFNYLLALSHNFRIVAYTQELKNIVRRLVHILGENKVPFFFDAVYRLEPNDNGHLDLTHIMIDF